MKKGVVIVGAGPVGCLCAIYLARRGYSINVMERRRDMRLSDIEAGRSINLALSNRGIRALREAGLELTLNDMCIPMNGRMMHNAGGETSFLPYGREGQFINSISRSALNVALINEAEANGVSFHFESRVTGLGIDKGTLLLESGQAVEADIIIGADGVSSAVRHAMEERGLVESHGEIIDHRYKELSIPPGPAGFQLEKNALHIWPRESFMLIALPNPDGSFTCTLFLASSAFVSLANHEKACEFFRSSFTDAAQLIPDLEEQWIQNPNAELGTLRCKPWSSGKVLLIGDAAHAVVPFYGQGMNAGFEDCRILNELLNKHSDNWLHTIEEFESVRKPDADAIAQLALDNFIEMRDLVADPEFLLQKRIEARLHQLFPKKWIPLYSMVTFEDTMRYSDALRIGLKQKKIMQEVMSTPGIAATWEKLDFNAIIAKLDT
jgi:kynurenine 3-monooxygenase